MRALMVRMVRDRTILFVLAPLLAIGGIVAAATMDERPTQERAADEREADERGATDDRRGEAEAEAGTDAAGAAGAEVAGATESADGGATTYSGGGSAARADALGYDGGATFDPSTEVLDDIVVNDPAAPPTTAPASATTVPGATTTVPGATTTTPTTSPTTTAPTTTVPGPPPVVSESPAVVLLPITGIVVAGLALGLLSRRRRRVEPGRSTS